MKCAVCSSKLQETFLNKIIGTYIKANGKRVAICFECQKKFTTKEELLAQIK